MFTGLLGNAINQIAVVEAFVEANDVVVKGQASDKQSLFRAYGTSSCVTRLYAIYEHFVESVISDYLDALPELIRYSGLPEGLKKDYRFGISHLLSKIDNERYSHLRHENVVKWYHQALADELQYRFVPEALTRHDQNLRLNIVIDLLSRVGLDGFDSWISRSGEILALYEEHTSVSEQLAAEVKAFVQVRNDAAHGVLEDIAGKDVLIRYCKLVEALLRSITSYVYSRLLLRREGAGRVVRVGVVTEVFERAGAFVAQLQQGRAVLRGAEIHLVSAGHCERLEVQSLQVNGEDFDSVLATQDEFEVGIKCNKIPRKKAKIFLDVR